MAFTHFDQIKGQNFQKFTDKRAHVMASVLNALSSLRDVLGISVVNAMEHGIDSRCFMLGGVDSGSHFNATTPKHGSWLNQAEIEIGLFSRQCLGKRRIPDLKTLTRETRAWNRRMNTAHTRIHWRFGRKDARRKFRYNKNTFKRSEN